MGDGGWGEERVDICSHDEKKKIKEHKNTLKKRRVNIFLL